MSRFNKNGGREMPEMNTSSLPDLIFTILFFFMIVTTMREVTLQVKITVPNTGTELEKLEKKSAVSFIYVGPPTDQYRAKYGSKPRMQLNNKYAEPQEIKDFIYAERQSMSDQTAQVVSMKIDKDTKMSLINAIKKELRNSWALKINYSAGSGGSTDTK